MMLQKRLSILLLLVFCVGCFAKAQVNTLVPSMELAWPAVRVEAVHGGASEAQVNAFAVSLAARDVSGIVTMWPTVRSFADLGITRMVSEGDISIGVAGSLRERLNNFEESVQALAAHGGG